MKRINRRPLTLTGLLIVAALCLSLMPRPTSAVRLTLTLADDNASYGAGRFFRTGLTRDQPDGPGGVQLVPTRLQKPLGPSANLPIPLSAHTSAVYRDRIFVVAGKTFAAGSNTTIVNTGQFFSTKLADPETGALRPWTDQPVLPALPIAISDATSAVVTVNNKPFLIVMGGQRQVGSFVDDVTTSRIFYYPIVEDNNGNLVVQAAWGEITDQLQRLPMGTMISSTAEGTGSTRGAGVSGMGVATITLSGTPYVYVFGGFNRVYSTGGGHIKSYLSDVWRAAISESGGVLTFDWGGTKVGTLGATNSRPNGVALAGMATAIANHPEPQVVDTAVYLIGGTRCTASCDDNNAVTAPEIKAYAVRIGPDGSLNWLPDGDMSEARSDHDAIQAQGQVLLVAGRANDNPSVTGAKGFVGTYDAGGARTVDDDLSLYRDPAAPSSANFELVSGFLGAAKARMKHTLETIPGTMNNQFVYLLGGQVEESQGSVTGASAEVLFGNLQEPQILTDNVVSDGKYYSKVYDFGPNATFFNFYPTLLFKREDGTNVVVAGQNVEIQYRVGDSEAALGAWSSVVPGTDGRNTIVLPAGTTGRYFQYMISLFRSSTNPIAAPILDKVELDVNRNGFPNIQMSSQSPFTMGSVNQPDPVAVQVAIANQATSPTVPSLNANWDAEGSFYVIMYRLAPNQIKPRADWPNFGDPGIAFVEVGKSSLPANSRFNIPPSTWRQWCATAPSCPQVNNAYWRSLFNSIGDYEVYVLVDANGELGSFGDVKEADNIGTAGEADNLGGPYTVHVNVSTQKFYTPMAFGPRGVVTATEELGRMPWPHFIK